eukprot:scaffold23497_cov106-Cylindrotheca_fusiformis.AAC.4
MQPARVKETPDSPPIEYRASGNVDCGITITAQDLDLENSDLTITLTFHQIRENLQRLGIQFVNLP